MCLWFPFLAERWLRGKQDGEYKAQGINTKTEIHCTLLVPSGGELRSELDLWISGDHGPWLPATVLWDGASQALGLASVQVVHMESDHCKL